MSIKTSSELMGEAVLRAREHWRRPRPGETLEVAPAQRKAAATACTITISRESGAGGSTIAREVGRLLDWPVYDRELLERIADQAGLRSELLESLDEKRSHWLVEILESLSGVMVMSGAAYARYLAETILALAAHGQCVIVGRGSSLIVPPNQSLRVRLVAKFDDRAERTRERLGVSKEEAIAHVRQNDAHRDGFVKDYFHHNVGDPHDYDLVINTSRFSLEQAAGLIIDALRER
ncbi:MAG TPA: cytidylate kinase-like family protein [Pirellulales bacterium]|nr:cytidylate kinase-like family protein [Pirellulales bacterium]